MGRDRDPFGAAGTRSQRQRLPCRFLHARRADCPPHARGSSLFRIGRGAAPARHRASRPRALGELSLRRRRLSPHHRERSALAAALPRARARSLGRRRGIAGECRAPQAARRGHASPRGGDRGAPARRGERRARCGRRAAGADPHGRRDPLRRACRRAGPRREFRASDRGRVSGAAGAVQVRGLRRSDGAPPAAPGRAYRARACGAAQVHAGAHCRAQRGQGDMSFSAILYGVADGVATVTLNRPDSRNALNLAMCEDLVAAVAAASADESIRLVLVRSVGQVFCAGADLKERKDMSTAEVRNRRLRGYAAYGALEALPMPTVAVVQGAAIGSGVEIAAACDFIVATPQATFATPEAVWGTVGATQRLPRVLGKRLAKDMMFTGRKLTAAEAREAGLVTRIVEAAQLDGALAELAQTIGKASAVGLRLAKRAIDQGLELDPRGALAVELAAVEENLASSAGGDGWRDRMGSFKGSTDK